MWRTFVTRWLAINERSLMYLAHKAEVNYAHLNKCMRGLKEPGPRTKGKLAKAMGILPTEIDGDWGYEIEEFLESRRGMK